MPEPGPSAAPTDAVAASRAGGAPVVALLGLGEAGSLIGADLARAGAVVCGHDPAVDAAEGVATTPDPADAVRDADLVLSLNGSADALEAARSVAGALRPGAVYADANTSSPRRKREVADALAATGALVADAALMQPVPGRGLRTPVVASGPGAARLAELLAPLGASVAVLDDAVGAAAARKLARSVFWKGMAAAVGEALATGERLGCGDWLRRDVERTLQDADAALVEHLVAGSRRHAVRRGAEMRSAEAMVAELGLEPRVARASAEWLEELARRTTA